MEAAAIDREIEAVALQVHDVWSGHLASLSFDETWVGVEPSLSSPADVASLTAPAVLGPDPGDGPGPDGFDDFDDFEGYAAPFAADLRGQPLTFDVEVAVDYVDPGDLDAISLIPTSAKRAVVTVCYTTPRADRAVDDQDRMCLEQAEVRTMNAAAIDHTN